VSFHRWWKRRHSPSIATHEYPASPHCRRDAVARPWRWPCHPIAAGSRSRRADRPIDRSCVGAGWSAAQSACGATTFLWSEKGSPGFPPDPARKARPPSPLSMMRLCAFAEQTSLPQLPRSRLEAAPTAFLLTEPTARRDGRPYPRSQQVVHA